MEQNVCANCGKTKDRHHKNPFGKYECDITYDGKPNVNMRFKLIKQDVKGGK